MPMVLIRRPDASPEEHVAAVTRMITDLQESQKASAVERACLLCNRKTLDLAVFMPSSPSWGTAAAIVYPICKRHRGPDYLDIIERRLWKGLINVREVKTARTDN